MSERMTAAERKRVATVLRKWPLHDGIVTGADFRLAADYLDPPEPPGTVRVRVACFVPHDGEWRACGAQGYDDDSVAEDAERETGWKPGRLTWVEASVPLPEPPATVEGSVTP